MTDSTPSPVDPLVDAIARRVVQLLRETPGVASPTESDAPVPLARLIALFPGTGEGFWRAAISGGDLPGYRLSRQRLAAKPSEAAAFLSANPLKVRPVKKAGEPELSGLDAALASGALISRKARAR